MWSDDNVRFGEHLSLLEQGNAAKRYNFETTVGDFFSNLGFIRNAAIACVVSSYVKRPMRLSRFVLLKEN